MSCLKYGLQACTQYSRCGLTSDLYSLSSTSCSLLTIVLLIIPSVLFALFAASTHCLDGFALQCMMTPRSLSSFIPAISIVPLQVLYHSEALPTTTRILYRSFTPKRTGNCR